MNHPCRAGSLRALLFLLGATLVMGCGSDDPSSPMDTTPPVTVTDLAVANVAVSSVTLTWTAPSDDGTTRTAAQYDVRYAAGASAAWEDMTQATGEPTPRAPGETESFTVAGLLPATAYEFRLRTADAAGNWSRESNAASATTEQTPDTSAPWWGSSSTGTGFATPTTLLLWWFAPTDDRGAAAHYDIRYATTAQAPWDAMRAVADATLPAPPNEHEVRTIDGLESDTPYYFRIRAADAAGNWSSESNEAVGRTTRIGAGTEVTGDVLLDMVWSADASPYHINGNVSIRDATLTIAPGVEVRGGEIRIAPFSSSGVDPDETGLFIADANSGTPIHFADVGINTGAGTVPTVLSNPPDFTYVSGSILRNCVLDSTTVRGESRLSLVDCTIRGNRTTAMWLRNPSPASASPISVVRCRFEDNRWQSTAACIQLEGGWLRMHETTMVRNAGFSIVYVAGEALIEGCRFEENTLFTPAMGATITVSGTAALDLSCSSFTGNLYDVGYGCREILVDATVPSVTVGRCNFEQDRTVIDNDSPGQLDARDNWWGTTSRDLIEAAIRDSLDVPCCRGRVLYEPFRSAPVGSEECGKGTSTEATRSPW